MLNMKLIETHRRLIENTENDNKISDVCAVCVEGYRIESGGVRKRDKK